MEHGVHCHASGHLAAHTSVWKTGSQAVMGPLRHAHRQCNVSQSPSSHGRPTKHYLAGLSSWSASGLRHLQY
eukprot:1161082-Pelagomonas_calceolata.AAC.6